MERPRVSSYCKANFSRAVFAASKRAVPLKLHALAANLVALWLRQSRHGPLFALLMLAAALCGCSASNVIGLYAADYRDTTANAGDAQLLLNILRARDNLPIHFYDLAIIHGSIQLTAGAGGSVPFELNNSVTPGTIVPAFSAQSAPSFDVSTSDTQDFTRGLLTQIDARVVKALFDEGVDPRIMLLLFFSGYHQPGGKVFLNTMACDPSDHGDPNKDPQGGCLNQVYAYLGVIDRTLDRINPRLLQAGLRPKLQANIYYALNPVGGWLTGAWTLDQLDALRQLDATKYRLIRNQLFSVSDPRLAICYERGGTLHLLFPSRLGDRTGDRACTQNEVIKFEPPTKEYSGLTLRSTYDIIQFLGQILRFQQEKGNNRCLTLDKENRSCDTGEVLFQVNAPVGAPVIGTRYGDAWYALSDRGCNKNKDEYCDYSLQVLAILELLLNENRQAKDIISTPRVQFVQ
jgi:hypothetical protein